jgi:hypothetical protein
VGYRPPERESWNMQRFEMLTLQRWIFGYVVSGAVDIRIREKEQRRGQQKGRVVWLPRAAVPDGLTLIF